VLGSSGAAEPLKGEGIAYPCREQKHGSSVIYFVALSLHQLSYRGRLALCRYENVLTASNQSKSKKTLQQTAVVMRREENQLDVTVCFIALMTCSTCFGHLYAHHQEL
jgi:hypothetical protein